MNKILLVLLLFVPLVIHAQDLQLTHNGKTQTIKAGTFIEVSLPVKETCEACPYYTVAGQLLSYANNKVHLKIKTSAEPIVENKIHIGSQTKTYTSGDGAPVMEISKDMILSVTKKGKNKVRENTTPRVIGNILIVLGMGHISVGGVEEIANGDGGFLLALGAAEFISGVVVGVVSKQKTFITNPNYPNLEGNQKIWKLE